MNNTDYKYEIPVRSDFYEDGEGPHVIVDGKTVYIVDRSSEKPNDLIKLFGTEISELIKILTDVQNGHMMHPRGKMEQYEEYRE